MGPSTGTGCQRGYGVSFPGDIQNSSGHNAELMNELTNFRGPPVVLSNLTILREALRNSHTVVHRLRLLCGLEVQMDLE